MFKVEEHESHINELTQMLKVEGVDQAKVSTILQAMRENYGEVDTTIKTSLTEKETLNKLNEGLRSANMNLLSKLGSSFDDKSKDGKNKDGSQIDDTSKDVKSLDDIAKEFLK